MMDMLGTLATTIQTLVQHLDSTTSILEVEREHNQHGAL
ncbi:hypothetical protein Patl1_15962 [Pistacia atlantica]|uniref:Uncharacterized protein n=1 Tax=Pistacia atlantica TaxID=434234 RepID=A0ACC1B8R7_9ROSI|nr:hypothetical protein Patl1_15962 [Pistacia atlantica]